MKLSFVLICLIPQLCFGYELSFKKDVEKQIEAALESVKNAENVIQKQYQSGRAAALYDVLLMINEFEHDYNLYSLNRLEPNVLKRK